MAEDPFFFTREDAHLFAMLHSPAGAAHATAFVMSHPFGEEKLWSHRVFVSTARALAARGHAVLRFDYMGAGDSSGLTPDTSLDSHLADLRAAVRELRRRVPNVQRVGLIGLRLGATFAALVAEAGECDGPLVLWDPVVDGEAYFQELLRINLSTQLAVYGKVQETREVLQEKIRAGQPVNVDGYEIGKMLFESCARNDLLGLAAKRHAGPALVVQIAANEKAKERDDLKALAGHYNGGTAALAIEHPFWREIKPFCGRAANLERVTLEWLERGGA
jgi:exosortase A-associated hydrolase 2